MKRRAILIVALIFVSVLSCFSAGVQCVPGSFEERLRDHFTYGRKLSRRFVYQGLSKLKSSEPPVSQEDVVEHLVEQLWVGEQQIYPCFDLGVADVRTDDTLVLSGNRAGYAPRPWGKNWTGTEGPFVLSVIGTWWE